MSTDKVRPAPAGAPDAPCEVCGRNTGMRIVEGEGHVPMCSDCCLDAWPRVKALLADRDEWKQQHENALACWKVDVENLTAARDEAIQRAESAENLAR